MRAYGIGILLLLFSITAFPAPLGKAKTEALIARCLLDQELLGAAEPRTSTLTHDGKLVPWMASEGPLSYQVSHPPPEDSPLFQYTRMFPSLYSSQTPIDASFGSMKNIVGSLNPIRLFWQAAREKKVNEVTVNLGERTRTTLKTPLAVYEFPLGYSGEQKATMLVQQGNYFVINPSSSQPYLKDGYLILYRGIGDGSKKVHPEPNGKKTPEENAAKKAFLDDEFSLFSDSRYSFILANNKQRDETRHISGTLAKQEMELRNSQLRKTDEYRELKRLSLTPYTTDRVRAERNFGPHFVTIKVPIDNIRITSLYVGENEINVIDPDRIEYIDNPK